MPTSAPAPGCLSRSSRHPTFRGQEQPVHPQRPQRGTRSPGPGAAGCVRLPHERPRRRTTARPARGHAGAPGERRLLRRRAQAQRTAATGLLQPRLAFLDEIDSGMDVDGVRAVVQFVHQLRAKGTALVVISHYLHLIESLAPDTVLRLDQGCIAETGGWTWHAASPKPVSPAAPNWRRPEP